MNAKSTELLWEYSLPSKEQNVNIYNMAGKWRCRNEKPFFYQREAYQQYGHYYLSHGIEFHYPYGYRMDIWYLPG
jgi:hypothetical protein